MTSAMSDEEVLEKIRGILQENKDGRDSLNE